MNIIDYLTTNNDNYLSKHIFMCRMCRRGVTYSIYIWGDLNNINLNNVSIIDYEYKLKSNINYDSINSHGGNMLLLENKFESSCIKEKGLLYSCLRRKKI